MKWEWLAKCDGTDKQKGSQGLKPCTDVSEPQTLDQQFETLQVFQRLSQPRDSTEPCTPIEALLQTSRPLVTPPPCYCLFRSLERWISSIYSNYVPLLSPATISFHPVMCNKPVFKSMGHYSSTPEYRTRCSTCLTCSAVCFRFNQGTIDLCFLSVSLPTPLPQCS